MAPHHEILETNAWEREILRFAREALYEPGLKALSVFSRMEQGKVIPESESRLHTGLWPVPLSLLSLAALLKSGLRRSVFGPGYGIFVALLGGERSRLIWAGILRESGGLPVEIVSFSERLHDAWAVELTGLLQRGEYADARRLLAAWAPEQAASRGWPVETLLVADLNALDRLLRAKRKAGEGKGLSLPVWVFEALLKIQADQSVQIEPAPPLAPVWTRLGPGLRLPLIPLRLLGLLGRLAD